MLLPGLEPPAKTFSTDTRAVIIGAGLAGCAVARALVNAGYRCVLYDRNASPAGGTSAVPCALVRPQVTKTSQTTTLYFDQAFNRIHDELKRVVGSGSQVFAQLTGALQLVKSISQWPANQHYSALTKTQASDLAGVTLASDALYFDKAGWIDMHSLCQHWITQCHAQGKNSFQYLGGTHVQSLETTADGWQLLNESNDIIDCSPLVIVASGELACGLQQTAHLPLQRSRGQLSHFSVSAEHTAHIPNTIITGKGSVIPVDDGIWTGSTHHRHDNIVHCTPEDDLINVQNAIKLCPDLANGLNSTGSSNNVPVDKHLASRSWTGFRYSTPDRLPVVGAAPDPMWYRQHYADLRHGRRQQQFPQPCFHDGLYLATGFGSRGALHSIYASDTLASIISGGARACTDPEHTIRRLLHPGRFIVRQLRSGK